MDKTELMKDVLKVTGIAPIIAYAEPEQAVPAAKALVAGGLPVVEVLMRNEHAMGNLERIARDVPEIVAGAGTIITLDQAKAPSTTARSLSSCPASAGRSWNTASTKRSPSSRTASRRAK